jgi:hypothetical protein
LSDETTPSGKPHAFEIEPKIRKIRMNAMNLDLLLIEAFLRISSPPLKCCSHGHQINRFRSWISLGVKKMEIFASSKDPPKINRSSTSLMTENY